MPVAVHLVELGEVIERGVGRIDDVAAAVVPPVLLELETPAGARDELPQPGSVRARVGHGIEGALHHREQRELGGQAPPIDLHDDVIEVRPAAVEDALQVLWIGGVFTRLSPHQRVVQVRHGESLANALPNILRARRAVDLLDTAQGLLDLPALAVEWRQRGRLENHGWRRKRGRDRVRGLGGGRKRRWHDGGGRRLRLRFGWHGRTRASLHQGRGDECQQAPCHRSSRWIL